MTPSPLNAPPTKPSAMPVVAAVLAALGFCFPPLFIVAIILAIISLARGEEPAFAARKTMAIIVLVVTPMAGLLYVPMVGILAAIAIPNFIKFQARSKQTECKTNLKAAYVAQSAFFAKTQRWGVSAAEIGFAPGPGTRYTYRLGPDGVVPASLPGAPVKELEAGYPRGLLDLIGSHGECPDGCVLTMACAGNIDNDPFIDVWTVSSSQRVMDGEVVPAGTPFNERNDVRD